MKKLQDYIIPFSGLKEGLHTFSFVADDRFFDSYENTEITGGDIKIVVSMQKNNTYLQLEFTITGTIKTICDKCLEEFNVEVNAEEILYMRFGEDYTELEDNVIIIPRHENRIDISQYIYEYAVLNLPIKRVHPVDINGKPMCNPDMLEILRKHSSEPKNNSESVWDSLKDMIN